MAASAFQLRGPFPHSGLKISKEDFELYASLLTPSIEDAVFIIGSVLQAYQSIYVRDLEDPRILFFPFSWYLKPGDVITSDENEKFQVINVIENPDTGGVHYNERYYLECGQKVRLDKEPDFDPEAGHKIFTLPEPSLMWYTYQEPPEEYDREQTAHSRASFVATIEENGNLLDSARGRKLEAEVDDDQVARRTTMYRMRGIMSIRSYSFRRNQALAMCKYIRDFSRFSEDVISKLGIRRFLYSGTKTAQTVQRQSEPQPMALRLYSIPTEFEVHTHEFMEDKMSTLDILFNTVRMAAGPPAGFQSDSD